MTNDTHGVSLDFDQYQKLKDVDRVLPDIVPDLKKTLPCQLTHQNVDSAMYFAVNVIFVVFS
jgi:hypothetical protein